MTHKREAFQPSIDLLTASSPLHDGVRCALKSRRARVHAVVAAAGIASMTPLAFGAAFPPVFPLGDLYPDGGGDGSSGFVLAGIDVSDHSGFSVSAAGDVNGDGIDDLLIGAYEADPGGRSSAGESYVVFGSTQGFPALFQLASLEPAGGGDGSRGVVLAGSGSNDFSGRAVSAAGDVNGDGIDDVIVGVAFADLGGRVLAGKSYVVFGSTQGFPAIFQLASLEPQGGGDGRRGFVLPGIREDDLSGFSVSAAGDVNGDGIDDLIIGAFQAGASGAGEGYVVFGSTQGFPAVFPLVKLYPAGGGDGSQGFVLTGIHGGDRAGYSVSAAGDVNGDGIDDFVVGAYLADPGGDSNAGESYVVFGSTQGFAPVFLLATLYPARGGDGSRGFVLTGIDANDNSGSAVSAAGDVNGDGIDDLIVGAHHGDPDPEAGESYVVFGSTQGFPAIVPLGSLFPAGGGDGSRGFVLAGIDAFDDSGRSVSEAGDLNGDGIDDVIIGAPDADPVGPSSGESYVVFGSTQGFPAIIPLDSLYPTGGGDGSQGFVLTGIHVYDEAGRSVSAAGDVNGDGMDDLIIGAHGADPDGRVHAGASYVVFGRATP